MDFPHKWAHLRHAELLTSTCSGAHHQIGACKQYVETIHVFGDASVRNFCITKLTLYDQKWMLHFTSCGGFSVFYLFVPVGLFVCIWNLDTGGTKIDSEFYF